MSSRTAGWDIERPRLQRALRPHAGGDRAEPAREEDQAQDRRRGRPRLGEQPSREAGRGAAAEPAVEDAPLKKNTKSTSAAQGRAQGRRCPRDRADEAHDCRRSLPGDDWLFEVKWDGVRAIAFIDNEEVRLQSRSGHALRAAVSRSWP